MTPKQVQDYLIKASKSKTVRFDSVVLILWAIAKTWGIATHPEIAVPIIAGINLYLRSITTESIGDK